MVFTNIAIVIERKRDAGLIANGNVIPLSPVIPDLIGNLISLNPEDRTRDFPRR